MPNIFFLKKEVILCFVFVFLVSIGNGMTQSSGRHRRSDRGLRKDYSKRSYPEILPVVGKVFLFLLAVFVGKSHAALFTERRVGHHIIISHF